MSNQIRLQRMRLAMGRAGLNALVLRLPENILLLSGYWPMIAAGLLVFPAEGNSISIIPDCYRDESHSFLWESEPVYFSYGCLRSPDPATAMLKILSSIPAAAHWRRVGYESNFEVVAPSWNSAEAIVPMADTRSVLHASFPDCELVDASRLLKAERMTKTPFEIARLRVASEISCIGLEAFEGAVAVGVSGVELAAEIERAVMAKGTGYGDTKRVRAYAQVTTGVEETALGYRPNVVSTSRRIEEGDVALLELGLVADGYWSDRTRVRVAGVASDEQQELFDTVLRAQMAAIAAIRCGVQASEIDRAARSIIEDAGHASCFPHITGHGLGFGYHEASPLLSPASDETLLEGMMTSVEPGIYHSSFGGFRIEDDVIVTDSGAEVLGPFRKFLT